MRVSYGFIHKNLSCLAQFATRVSLLMLKHSAAKHVTDADADGFTADSGLDLVYMEMVSVVVVWL